MSPNAQGAKVAATLWLGEVESMKRKAGPPAWEYLGRETDDTQIMIKRTGPDESLGVT